MYTWKQGLSLCDLFKEKIWSKKIKFIARKQSWNQSMAAYDSDLEDFKIDKKTIRDSKINLKVNEYSSEEIEVNPTKEFNVHEYHYIDKYLTDSPLLFNVEPPDIKFIDEKWHCKSC